MNPSHHTNDQYEHLLASIQTIKALDHATMIQSQNRMDQLVKPQGSLGKLEDLAIQLSGIYRTPKPYIKSKAVVVMCADNGVCEEDIASAPQIVTYIQSINISKGVSGVGALAKAMNATVYTVDIGINSDDTPEGLINRKIMKGTHNIRKTHAMSYEQAVQAILVGIETVKKSVHDGHSIIATGEMGIGNTTTSTAILSLLTGLSPKELTGVGANFPVEKLDHKANVISDAIYSKDISVEDPIALLAAVGGLDIAGLTGVMLGGAIYGVPVVVDGYISTIAALLACRLNPLVKSYLIPSHASHEKSAALATELLGLEPYLHLNMRLGEGSGAVLAFDLASAACTILNDMITFEEAGIGVV